MSDVGKLQRPEATSVDAVDIGEHAVPESALKDERGRAGDELKFRASGGAQGVAPMERLMNERRSIGSQLAGRVQRKAEGAAGNVEIPQSAGAKLPSQVRQRMEPKLGADLSDVQVHTGGESAKAAQGLGARAFTVGHDVHFNAGEFAPGSKEGDRLLAHELTHVVQGKKSGVQRKPDDGGGAAPGGGAAGGEHGAAGGGAGAAGGHEVSHPEEPAEKEADAVADGVTDSLHGAGDKKAGGKGKGKDKDKKDAKGGDAHGGGEDAHDGGGHEAAHDPQQAGGGGGAHEGASAHGAAGGDKAAGGAAPAEKPAPISAKYIGVGRKIFRAKGPSSAPAPAGKGPDPKQAQIDKAKAVKTAADVDAFCAQDPIATQKLSDVKAETNLETDSAAAKTQFYAKLATWIQTNAETVNPKTIFNSCMNNLAGEWKFKGKKLDLGKLPKSMQRTQGLPGFYYTAADKDHYQRQAAPATDPKAAYALWKVDAKTNPMAHVNAAATINPTKDGKKSGTWFTPDSYKLGNASDAGYQQLLELAALQPEWFPEGNIVFEIDVGLAKGSMEARRPTAYDGMQSSLWVSRSTGETYGVTGGGANEFLAGDVPVGAMKNARMVAGEDDTMAQLRKAVTEARDLALQQDPELKKRIDGADAAIAGNKNPDPKMKEQLQKARNDLEAMIPNLTDMYLRGNAPGPIGAAVQQMLAAIKQSTEGERSKPSPTRAPGVLEAPSAKAGAAGASSAATKSDPSAKGPKKS